MGKDKAALKQILRQEARRHRGWMDPAAEDLEAFADHFFKALQPQEGTVIAAYWPKGREFDPRSVLEHALVEKIICALPVVQEGSKELKFARWDESIELKPGPYGVMEPSVQDWVEPDIVIVPLLAFDRRGYRLGQGGGYYDVTLKALREKKKVLAVGAAYARDAVLFSLPVEEHDQKLDWVMTPEGAQAFS